MRTFQQEEPILVLTRREGTDFVLTLDSPVHLWYLRYAHKALNTVANGLSR